MEFLTTTEEKTGAKFFAAGAGLMLLSAISMERENKTAGRAISHTNDLQAVSYFVGMGLMLYGANRYAPGAGWIAGGLFIGMGEINKFRRAEGKAPLSFLPGIEVSFGSKGP